jgi:pullulanase
LNRLLDIAASKGANPDEIDLAIRKFTYISDAELGYLEGNLSPTSNQDLTEFINSCHDEGIRIILDVVLGFMREEPYRRVDFDDFYLEDPPKHPDAFNSRKGGGKEFRNPFGGSCPRYVKTKTTYDPISGAVKEISPARQHMLTFLTRWMQDFQIDGHGEAAGRSVE